MNLLIVQAKDKKGTQDQLFLSQIKEKSKRTGLDKEHTRKDIVLQGPASWSQPKSNFSYSFEVSNQSHHPGAQHFLHG